MQLVCISWEYYHGIQWSCKLFDNVLMFLNKNIVSYWGVSHILYRQNASYPYCSQRPLRIKSCCIIKWVTLSNNLLNHQTCWTHSLHVQSDQGIYYWYLKYKNICIPLGKSKVCVPFGTAQMFFTCISYQVKPFKFMESGTCTWRAWFIAKDWRLGAVYQIVPESFHYQLGVLWPGWPNG